MLRNNSTVRIIEKVTEQAREFLAAGNYIKVVELLQPYSSDKSSNTIHMLAVAYMETTHPANGKELALPLWITILQSALKEPDYDDAVIALTSIVICYQHRIELHKHKPGDVQARETFTQRALKYTEEHTKEFKIRNARGKEIVSEELRKQRRYTLCLNAGIFNMCSGNSMESRALSQPFYTTAKKYFDIALTENPNDLKCLLYKARVAAAEQSPRAALRLLTLYEDKHSKSPSYHECMRILCSLTEEESCAAEYKSKYLKYCADGTKDNLSYIFSDLILANDECDNSPLEILKIAVKKSYEGKDKEAKMMISDVLRDHPSFLCALEFSLHLEDKCGDPDDKAPLLREEILAIDPHSILALKSKAHAIIKDTHTLKDAGETYILSEQNEAYMLFMQAYDFGCRDEDVLNVLTAPEMNFVTVSCKVEYALEYTRLKPSANTFFNLAFAYFRGNQYENALLALQQVRMLDVDYQNDWVSLAIIYCLIMQASSDQDYHVCVKKLKNYISRHPSSAYSIIVDMLVRYLQYRNMDVSALVHTEVTEQKEQKSSAEDKECNWVVPEDIKAKIKELMLQQAPISHDKPQKSRDSFNLLADLKAKKVRLYPLGDPGQNVFGYIDPKTNASHEEKVQFEKVLESNVELSASSKGRSGIKKFPNGNRVLKVSGSGSRMPSRGAFFIPSTVDSPEMKLIPFKKVKSHNVAYNDVYNKFKK